MEKILELLLENPETIVAVVKGSFEKYKPVIYDLLNEIVNVYRDYSNNTEYPAIVAKTKKNIYDAYVAAGFTEDQALALMINDNIQLMKNVKTITESSKNMNQNKSL